MEQSQRLAHVVLQATRQIAEAMPRLRSFAPISHYTVEVNRLENEGDRISRDAIASLFESGIDPLVVIRWKDIFKRLEEAVDACEHVANTLEGTSSRTRELRRRPGHRRRHRPGVRLHQRLSRHRQRDRHLGLDAGDVATHGGPPVRRPELRRRFISLKVAATVAQGIVESDDVTTTVVFAGLIGAIAWNLATWYFGLPSSSSHALIGGLVGAPSRPAARADPGRRAGREGHRPRHRGPDPRLHRGRDRDPHRLPHRRPAASRARQPRLRLGQLSRARCSRSPTGPTTRRRRWGSSRWRWSRTATCRRPASRSRPGSSSRRRPPSRWAPTPVAGGSSAPWAAGSSRWTRRRASRRRGRAPRWCSRPRTSAIRCRPRTSCRAA